MLKLKEIVMVLLVVSISFVFGNILDWHEERFGILELAHPQISKDGLPVVKIENTEGKINVNTATSEELCSIKGIGEKTAGRIITYREKNGRFNVIEDVMKVNGIGWALFNKIKDLICV